MNESSNIPNKLFRAIDYDDISTIQEIFNDSNIDILKLYEVGGYTVLHKAAYHNSEALIDLILEKLKESYSEKSIKKFINKPNDQEYRAIHYASFRNNVNIIKKLYQLGADVNILTKKGLNVLHFAAQNNSVNSFIYMIEKFGIVLDQRDKFGSNPLHWSCFSGSIDVFNFIITRYAHMIDINSQDNEGLTAFHLSVLSDKTIFVKKLLYKGINPNLKDIRNRTAMDLAKFKNKKEMENLIKDTLNSPFSCLRFSSVSRLTYIIFFSTLNYTAGVNSALILLNFHNHFVLFSFLLLFLSVLVSYVSLIFSNPGFIGDKSNFTNKELILSMLNRKMPIQNYCSMCLIKKHSENKHCHLCNSCVKEFDHHCYWINNCVGQNNYKLFLAFVTFLFIYIVFSLLSTSFIIFEEFKVVPYEKFNIKQILTNMKGFRLIVCIFSFVISLLFLLPVGLTFYKNYKNLITKSRKPKNMKKLQEVEDEDDLISTYENGFAAEASKSNSESNEKNK